MPRTCPKMEDARQVDNPSNDHTLACLASRPEILEGGIRILLECLRIFRTVDSSDSSINPHGASGHDGCPFYVNNWPDASNRPHSGNDVCEQDQSADPWTGNVLAASSSLLTLLFLGQKEWAAALFCVLYGLSNGILTIVKGTVPRELFGREHYGAIAGAMASPSLIALAAGPLVIAAVIEKTSSACMLLGLLLLVSVFSLGRYVAAVRKQNPTVRTCGHRSSMQ